MKLLSEVIRISNDH
jgi:hypothetical protein